jgi:tryptophan synthase alpha chain
MSRIAARFASLARQGRKALVPFVTAGDPSPEAMVPVLHALVAAGADVIELGVPFSDPMADGPVIQRSSERALERGMRSERVFDMVREFRRKDAQTPVVLMGYLNPVEVRGADAYARAAAEAGVDGLLLVDLPPEEASVLRAGLNERGLELISLVAPTTSAARLPGLAASAQGYLYYVSFAGVTGAQISDVDDVANRVTHLRSLAKVPVLVGFGIKDAASVRAVAGAADGVVVGSALVEALSVATSPEDAAARASAFLAPLRQALDSLPS